MIVADDTGQPAATAATEVRTFLIADVRGYTRFTREQGDEAASDLAAWFADACHAGTGGVYNLTGTPRAAARHPAARACPLPRKTGCWP